MRVPSCFDLGLSLLALGCSASAGGVVGSGSASDSATSGGQGGGQAGSGPQLELPSAMGGGASGASSDACAHLKVEFQRVTPTVMLLIDQSYTMTIRFEEGAAGRSRWNTVRDILTDPQTGLIPRFQDSVRFGLALFSAKTPEACPALTRVNIALGNYQAIREVYAGQEVLDHTPTSESVAAVTTDLAAYAEPGPKVIVLATDGNPDNCGNLDDNNSADGGAASKALVKSAVENAFAQGISTYVISVGDEVSELHLQELAKAGRGGAADATFYRALQTDALVSAFATILSAVQSCDFTLNGTVAGNDAPRGTVLLDGAALAFGAADGWDLPAADTVRLNGSACETAKLGAEQLDIQFPCGTIIPK